MRKKIVPDAQRQPSQVDAEVWLDVERLVDVELTSEDPEYPIESALLPGDGLGWRAAQAGEQTIRMVFHSPQHIRRVWLEIVEPSVQRRQQFVLRWSADGGETFQEIVRQQFNFSPAGATRETEDYRVNLANVSVIELTIVPEIGGGDSRASLARLFLA